MQPLVSFVVPVYNVEKYLSECVESILHQTNPNFEVILVDDGSPDHSPELCDHFAACDSRVSVIHKQNAGVSVARNCGINAAKGDWICFVDGDDWIDERFVELIHQSQSQDLDAVILCLEETQEKLRAEVESANAEPVMLADRDVKEILKNVLNRYYVGKFDLRPHHMTSACGKAYRRTLLQSEKIQFPPDIISGEDTFFNFQFFAVAKHVLLRNNVVYGYRKTIGSVTHRYNPKLQQNFLRVIAMMEEFLRNNNLDLENQLMLYCVSTFLFVSMLDFCHPQNPKSFSVRRREFLTLRGREIYQQAFQQASLEQFPVAKRLACLLLKYRCFSAFCFFNRLQMYH